MESYTLKDNIMHATTLLAFFSSKSTFEEVFEHGSEPGSSTRCGAAPPER